MTQKDLVTGPDGLPRCWWPDGTPLYLAYHDLEWGRPEGGCRRLFEAMCLDGFQAGLSWITILRKRENFRKAFANFEPEVLARFDDTDVARLLQDEGIIRHRGKIEAMINNAARACELIDEQGSLGAYIWSFEPPPAERPRRIDAETLRSLTTSPRSVAMSKDLKRRGWKFVGPTVLYAFMQSQGIVNDHLEGCAFRDEVEAERRAFVRPSGQTASP